MLASAPLRQSGIGGIKSIRPDRRGYNMNEISFAYILLATACPGSLSDILRVVSSVEGPRLACLTLTPSS